MGTGSFPGVKRPGRDVDPSPPSSAEVKNRVELSSSLPKGLRSLWKGETYLHTEFIIAHDAETLEGKEKKCLQGFVRGT